MGVIILAFMRKFEVTQAVLMNENYLGIVVDILVSQPDMFENHSYDRKVTLF